MSFKEVHRWDLSKEGEVEEGRARDALAKFDSNENGCEENIGK